MKGRTLICFSAAAVRSSFCDGRSKAFVVVPHGAKLFLDTGRHPVESEAPALSNVGSMSQVIHDTCERQIFFSLRYVRIGLLQGSWTRTACVRHCTRCR